MQGEQLNSLQGGRALAALAVVAHHSTVAARDFGGSYLPFLEYGWMGVDFFFVLSGFLIAYSVRGKSINDYTWHRFRRVLTPYYPIGIGIAVLYTLLPHIGSGIPGWSWLTSLTLIPYGSPALSVAWTLQHELVFYAVFGVAWFSQKLWLLPIWGLLCLLSIPSLPFESINLEFLMGVACFYVTKANFGPTWLWFAAMFVVALWILLGGSRDYSLFLGIGFAIMLPALVKAERKGLHIPTGLVFLGGASYSIYLAHNLAISVAVRINADMTWCFLVAIAIGVLYYFAVERALLKFVPK